MFNLRRLLSVTIELNVTDVFDAERFAQETINKVRGRVVRTQGGPNISGQASIRLSQDAASFEVLRNELLCRTRTPTMAVGLHAMAVRQSLLEPARVIPIADSSQGPGKKTTAILSMFRTGGSSTPLLLRSLVRTRTAGKGRLVSICDLDCEWFVGAETQMLELESIFRSAEPRARAMIVSVPGWPRRAFWIGGSRGEPTTLPEDWWLQVLGAGAVRGLQIETLE
jgi:hypothetical protein